MSLTIVFINEIILINYKDAYKQLFIFFKRDQTLKIWQSDKNHETGIHRSSASSKNRHIKIYIHKHIYIFLNSKFSRHTKLKKSFTDSIESSYAFLKVLRI